MERNGKGRSFGIWMIACVIALSGSACLVSIARNRMQLSLQYLRIRTFADGMQEVVGELIELNAIDDLKKFNNELGQALLDASQNLPTNEFWEKWDSRLRVIRSSKVVKVVLNNPLDQSIHRVRFKPE